MPARLYSVTPEQFREAIAGLGLNQTEAAKALEVDARTVRRWAAGEREIPGPVRVALRCMAQLRPRRAGDRKQ